ncbi:MAG: hypothetical protein JO110_01705 [Acetobacteraceae bacterium]|nr:hypothetical protein [Acetobacteraceae bacterium]
MLEAKRWKWEQRRRKYLATSWTRDGFEERLKAMLPCGGWRDNGRKAQGWVLLELARGSQGQEWISWSWQPDRFKDKPERIEQDMVDEFFRRYRADMWCNWRAALFQAAFCYAIDTNYAGREQFQGKRATATLHLVLNGRDYWFRRAETPSPWFFEALSLPEDTVTERFTVELPPASGWGIRD